MSEQKATGAEAGVSAFGAFVGAALVFVAAISGSMYEEHRMFLGLGGLALLALSGWHMWRVSHRD